MDERLWGNVAEVFSSAEVGYEQQAYLHMLLEMLWDYDEHTSAHCMRVGVSAYRAGEVLMPDCARALLYAGLLHDFGKILVPKEVLQRHGTDFSEKDYEQVMQHPEHGFSLLKERYPFSAEILLRHHRFQKRSYPEKLPPLIGDLASPEAAGRIEKCARLVAIVDFRDAFCTRGHRVPSHDDVVRAGAIRSLRAALLEEHRDDEDSIERLFDAGVLQECLSA